MVPRSRAEAVARQVWGDDWEGRIARAKTRAQKKKRRRQRDAVAKRKSYNEVRGTRVFVTPRGWTSCPRKIIGIFEYVPCLQLRPGTTSYLGGTL